MLLVVSDFNFVQLRQGYHILPLRDELYDRLQYLFSAVNIAVFARPIVAQQSIIGRTTIIVNDRWGPSWSV